MSMLEQYALKPESLDWSRSVDSWNWLLKGKPVNPLAFSMFGDWFLEDNEGNVHLLDTLEGQLRSIATSRAEFEKHSASADSCEEWFMADLVDLLRERAVALAGGQVYGYKVLPLLGGPLTADNIEPIDFVPYQLILAQTHEQARHTPPGSQHAEFTVDGRRPASKRWWKFWR